MSELDSPGKASGGSLPDGSLPDAHFGSSKEDDVDWRNMPGDNTPDDDEELPETPPDVIGMLGFDPLEFDPLEA